MPWSQNLLIITATALLAFLSSCQPMQDDVVVSTLLVADIPTDVAAVISAHRPDFVPEEVQKKVRGKRTYYDIEGESAGAEIEFDILMTQAGPKIVEIQRDLAWTNLPADVRTTYKRDTKAAEPVRIIESVQTDESIVYEFFLEGRPSEPSFEICKVQGQAPKLLTERAEH